MDGPNVSLEDAEFSAGDAFGRGRQIKSTRSLCPTCLERVDADVFERSGEVWMDKSCPTHGRFSARLSGDARHYYRYDERLAGLGSCCGPGQHCGDQVANHSCNVLMEITQRCNLTCPTCFAGSSPHADGSLSVEEFEARLDQAIAAGKGDMDLLQLSGGEPTVHPEFFEILELALARGIKRVYLNTNGIMLARPSFAHRLARHAGELSVYLQFDGFRRRTLRLLRGREDLLELKLAALDHCERLGLDTVPVMTLTAGVNESELGAFIDHASRQKCVHKVMIQPAMYSGRYENPRLVRRLGVAEVTKLVAEQTDGTFSERDFGPIPCSDPNCFSMALALRTPMGLLPVSRFFPRYESWGDAPNREMVGQLSDTFDSAEDLRAVMDWALSSGGLASVAESDLDVLLDRIEAWQALEGDGEWSGLFAIGIKPFMDAHTFDQDRVDKCCVHILSHDGSPVSFCEYNAIHRPRGTL
jgi:hypothetical protein